MLMCSYRFERGAAAIAYGWHKRRNFSEEDRCGKATPCQGSDVGDVASSQSVRLRSSNRASRSEFALATRPRSSLQADLRTLCPQRLGDAAEQHDAPQQPPMRRHRSRSTTAENVVVAALIARLAAAVLLAAALLASTLAAKLAPALSP